MDGKCESLLRVLRIDRIVEALRGRWRNDEKSFENYVDIAARREQIYRKTKIASG